MISWFVNSPSNLVSLLTAILTPAISILGSYAACRFALKNTIAEKTWEVRREQAAFVIDNMSKLISGLRRIRGMTLDMAFAKDDAEKRKADIECGGIIGDVIQLKFEAEKLEAFVMIYFTENSYRCYIDFQNELFGYLTEITEEAAATSKMSGKRFNDAMCRIGIKRQVFLKQLKADLRGKTH